MAFMDALSVFIPHLEIPPGAEQLSFQNRGRGEKLSAGTRFQALWAGMEGPEGKSTGVRFVILTNIIQFFRGEAQAPALRRGIENPERRRRASWLAIAGCNVMMWTFAAAPAGLSGGDGSMPGI